MSNSENSKAIEKSVRLSSDDLAAMSTWEEAAALLEKSGAVIEIFGDGFNVVDKDELRGVPFMIVDMHFSQGDYGEFVSVCAITKNQDKVVFNDGSTGVYAQIKGLVERRGTAIGLVVERGIRVSEYYRNEKTGETANEKVNADYVPAKTYYLD